MAPFVSDDQRFADAGVGEIAALPEEPDISFWSDTVPAAFRRENVIGSWLASSESDPIRGVQNPEFDPFRNIAGYETHAKHFIEADTPEEVSAIKMRIDRERADRDLLDRSGGLGIAAMFMAGIVDPVTFVPIGGVASKVYKGGSVLKGALFTAGSAMAGAAASEAGLQATQLDRSLTESALNVSGALFLGGIMGAAFHGLSKAKQTALVRAIEDENLMLGGKSMDEEAIIAKAIEEDISPEGLDTLLLDSSSAELTAREKWVGKIPGVAKMSPEMRIALRSRSAVAKAGLAMLSEQTVKMSKGVKGKLKAIRAGGRAGNPQIPVGARGYGLIEGQKVEVLRMRGGDDELEVLVRGLGEGQEDRWLPKAEVEPFPGDPYRRLPVEGESIRTEEVGRPRVAVSSDAPVVSAEGKVKHWSGVHLGRALMDHRRNYVNYRRRMAGQPRTDKELVTLKQLRYELADTLRHHGDWDYEQLTFRQFNQLAGEAARNGDEHVLAQVSKLAPEVAESARIYRDLLFNPMAERALDAGILPATLTRKTAPSYLTRVWDLDKLATDAAQRRFKEKAANWFMNEFAEMSEGEAQDAARLILNKIRSTPGARLPYEPVEVKIAGSLQPRTFLIPDRDIEEFLVSDIEEIAQYYFRTVAPDIALAENFGDVNMTHVINAIGEDYDYLKEIANQQYAGKELQKVIDALDKQRAVDIRDIEAMRDRLRGTFGAPQDPTALGVRAARAFRSMNVLAQMGGVTISSIPDVARPVMVNGLTRTLRTSVLPLARGLEGAKLVTKDLRDMGIGLEMLVDSRAGALFELDRAGRFGLTRGEGFIHGLSNQFGIINLLSPWNKVMKQWAGVVTQARILEAAEAIAKAGDNLGPLAKEIDNLAHSRIDLDTARIIAAQFRKHGKTHKGFKVANVADWDPEASRAFELFANAVREDVDRTIVTPGIGDRPLWMSTEMGKTIGQYKSFAFSAVNRVMVSGLQQKDMAALNGAMLTVAMGMGVYAMKQKLAGRPISDDPRVLVREGVDRGGLIGIFGDGANIMDKMNFGPNRIIDGPVASRYASRNVTSSLAGPTFGLAETMVSVLSAAGSGDFTETNVKQLRRMLPYNQVFYWKWLMDAAEKSAADAVR